MYKFGKRSFGILTQLHPVLQEILLDAIKHSPWDFGLHSGHRSVEKQYEYYKQGRTTEGPVVTWIDGLTKRGYHNYKPSLAFDFHCSVPGQTWDVVEEAQDGDPAYMVEIGEHIMKTALNKFGIKLVWGAHWRTPDYPHIQLPESYKKFAESERLY